MPDADELLFAVRTPLGFVVSVNRTRWQLIVSEKHPVMAGQEEAVRRTLVTPDEIRQSRSDSKVFLFYKAEREERWVCAVAKQRDDIGFLITAYPTDAIKEGVTVWPK